MTDLTSRNLPGSVEFLHLDVSDPTSIEAAAKTVEAKHGKSVISFNLPQHQPHLPNSPTRTKQTRRSHQQRRHRLPHPGE